MAVNGVRPLAFSGCFSARWSLRGVRPVNGLMTVTFRLGTDPDKAQQLVQNRVSQAEPRLPEDVRRLGVTTVKSAPDLTRPTPSIARMPTTSANSRFAPSRGR